MVYQFEDLKISSVAELEEQIKKIESMIRHSREYKAYVSYCKNVLQMRFSQTWKDIDFVENGLSLEIHHMITLYDLVMIIGTDLICNLQPGEYLLSWDIAKAVIEAHLNDEIPVVSLAVTEHEMIHAKLMKLNTSNEMIHLGNYDKFLQKYHDLLTDDQKDLYKSLGIDVDRYENEEDS